MASNVYTKNEILQSLASKGYFIDAYTLDTFFEKWKVEAIFEDEQGSEFYDKNALDLVMDNLFNSPQEQGGAQEEPELRVLKEPEPQAQPQVSQSPPLSRDETPHWDLHPPKARRPSRGNRPNT